MSVYFESHDGLSESFQMPCRFAGWVPGRDDEISRYRPYWNSNTENCGSLVLASTSEATAFGELPLGAHAELGIVIPAIEAALRDFVVYEKINYLMLMMVDPHVHFHILPRHSGIREWAGLTLGDAGWPGPPDLKSATALDPGQQGRLRDEIAARFD